jgi:hypothetical protein
MHLSRRPASSSFSGKRSNVLPSFEIHAVLTHALQGSLAEAFPLLPSARLFLGISFTVFSTGQGKVRLGSTPDMR